MKHLKKALAWTLLGIAVALVYGCGLMFAHAIQSVNDANGYNDAAESTTARASEVLASSKQENGGIATLEALDEVDRLLAQSWDSIDASYAALDESDKYNLYALGYAAGAILVISVMPPLMSTRVR